MAGAQEVPTPVGTNMTRYTTPLDAGHLRLLQRISALPDRDSMQQFFLFLSPKAIARIKFTLGEMGFHDAAQDYYRYICLDRIISSRWIASNGFDTFKEQAPRIVKAKGNGGRFFQEYGLQPGDGEAVTPDDFPDGVEIVRKNKKERFHVGDWYVIVPDLSNDSIVKIVRTLAFFRRHTQGRTELYSRVLPSTFRCILPRNVDDGLATEDKEMVLRSRGVVLLPVDFTPDDILEELRLFNRRFPSEKPIPEFRPGAIQPLGASAEMSTMPDIGEPAQEFPYEPEETEVSLKPRDEDGDTFDENDEWGKGGVQRIRRASSGDRESGGQGRQGRPRAWKIRREEKLGYE